MQERTRVQLLLGGVGIRDCVFSLHLAGVAEGRGSVGTQQAQSTGGETQREAVLFPVSGKNHGRKDAMGQRGQCCPRSVSHFP